jgi:hypothetical protein
VLYDGMKTATYSGEAGDILSGRKAGEPRTSNAQTAAGQKYYSRWMAKSNLPRPQIILNPVHRAEFNRMLVIQIGQHLSWSARTLNGLL